MELTIFLQINFGKLILVIYDWLTRGKMHIDHFVNMPVL